MTALPLLLGGLLFFGAGCFLLGAVWQHVQLAKERSEVREFVHKIHTVMTKYREEYETMKAKRDT